MKLSTTRFAQISQLLDEVLPLDRQGRRRWLDALSPQLRALLAPLEPMLLREPGSGEAATDLSGLPELSGILESTDVDSRFQPGDRVGPYQLVRFLGEGGMAEVWLAQRADGAFRREVALKMPVLLGRPRALADRFTRERDLMAALEHPNIARLYDAGISAEGVPFIAMEYVDGEPLTAWCDRRSLPVRERLQLFLQVIDAVQYAHGRQVIHRDIKPSNILVTGSGQARLLDFGVGKLLGDGDGSAELTRLHGRALTLEYASPELVRGDPIGAPADVYSLGVVLYELLAGSRPYRLKDTASHLQWEQAITGGQLEPPSARLGPDQARTRGTAKDKLVRLLKGDLDSIAMKALAGLPAQRYPDASALAEDLQRYLGGRGVLARRERVVDRAARYAKRHRAAASAAAAAAAALFAGAIGSALVRERPVEPAAPNGAAAPALPAAADAVDRKSIAVLPFVDMSEGHDQEFFSDGLSEELIERLARVQDLRVAARTSSFYFKNRPEDVAAIARQLHVAHLLEGSVRKTADRLRVTAQLIRADDGFSLWSQTYDRNLKGVFELQDDIAAAVTAASQARLLTAAPGAKRHGTESSDAHDHYLLGKLFANRGDRADYERAAHEFREAIALDPDYAAAHAALAAIESSLADQVGDAEMMRSALDAADRAIRLAPELADAYSARGTIRVLYLWDWAGSQADFDMALSLDAGQAVTQRGYAALLMARGRLDEAVAAAHRAVEADPLSSVSWQRLGFLLQCSGDLAGSRRALERALELAPSSHQAHYLLGMTEVLDGHGSAALALFRQVRFRPSRLFGVALAEQALGHAAESRRALQQLIAENARGEAFQIAKVYAAGGDRVRALDWLERAYSQHDGGIAQLAVDPFLRQLRGDPRFEAMRARMKMAG